MKRTPAIALFALSCLGVAARVIAQEPAVQANVPFQFTVGGRLMPADTYTITSPDHGLIAIQSSDKHSAIVTTASFDGNRPTKGADLVFTKYGDKYFLHEVQSAQIAGLNAKIPATKLEKEVRLQALNGQGQPVLIAAR